MIDPDAAVAPIDGGWRHRDGGVADVTLSRDASRDAPDDVPLPCDIRLGGADRCGGRCGTACPVPAYRCLTDVGVCAPPQPGLGGECVPGRTHCPDSLPCLVRRGAVRGSCVLPAVCEDALATGYYECLWSDLSPYTGPPPDEGACPADVPGHWTFWCGSACDLVSCEEFGQCAGVSSERAFGICTLPLPCDPSRPDAWPSEGFYACNESTPCACMQLASPLGWSHGIFTLGRSCADYRDRYGPDHVRCTPLGRSP